MRVSRRILLALVASCCLVVPALAFGQEPQPSGTPPAATPTPTTAPTPEEAAVEARLKAEARAEARISKKLRAKVRHHRKRANYWRSVTFKRPLRVRHKKLMRLNSIRLKSVLKYTKKAHYKARYHAKHPPNYSAWMCIHRHEGPWNAATGNGYYGGLQMDWTFMRMYGGKLLTRKGAANRWTPLEQIWVAERARRSGRGFYPWPNTARMCGLI